MCRRDRPRPGSYIRRQGSDVVAGAHLLDAGTRLAPHHLGALAAAGIASVTVHRRPRIAVLSTGSELVAAGIPLGPGQIYESNSTLLAALVRANGGDVCSVGTCLLYTSDAADERSSVDLGGRRILKKTNKKNKKKKRKHRKETDD